MDESLLTDLDSYAHELERSRIFIIEKAVSTYFDTLDEMISDKSLKGKHKGKFRKRAGNYRIVYLKENDILVITLVRIVHRK